MLNKTLNMRVCGKIWPLFLVLAEGKKPHENEFIIPVYHNFFLSPASKMM